MAAFLCYVLVAASLKEKCMSEMNMLKNNAIHDLGG